MYCTDFESKSFVFPPFEELVCEWLCLVLIVFLPEGEARNEKVVWLTILVRYVKDSNLVDSASSHTLVSKIKPCMSKYKSLTLKLRTAHYISYSLFDSPLLLG